MKNEFKRKMQKLRNKGFTLAELLIVVAIIAVLVAVSIPVFTGKLEQARKATTEANIRAAKAAAMADYMEIAKIKIKKGNGLFALMKDGLNLVVKASGDSDYVDRTHETSDGYVLYWYDAEKNELIPSADFETEYQREHGSDTGALYTDILVNINVTDGVIGTRPFINSSGTVVNEERHYSAGPGDNNDNSGGGGNTPVAKEYWNITVEKFGMYSDSAVVSASVDKVEKNSGGTVTLTGSGTSFKGWTIQGDYVEKGSIDLNSLTIEITPLSDITASARFGKLIH